MRLLLVFSIGIIFGLGITISGMINPAKVLNFFDIAGTWDPSLVFVMFSAMFTAMVGYKLVFLRNRPLFATEFRLPKAQAIDRKLVGGSMMFGIGWGIAGFCPGGAIPALGTGRTEVIVFCAAMVIGIIVARTLQNLTIRPAEA